MNRYPPQTAGNGARVVRVLGACTVTIAPDATRDGVIATLAGAQRGRMARWQLLAAGVSDHAIGRCLRGGRLVRRHRAVYAVPHSDQLPLAPDAGAVLACGPGALLCDHSAAVLWGLRPGVADPVHVVVPFGQRGPARDPAIVVHRTRLLSPADARLHQGLPVTSPARTVLDLAARLPERDVEQMLDEGLFVRRLLSRGELRATLRRAGGHPGRAALARIATRHTRSTKTDSRPEERLLLLVRAAGLPEPQHQVHALGYRLDLFWPQLKLAVEVDRYGTHGSPGRFERDRRRDARLLAELGIAVLRITDLQIEHRPYEVIATLARAIAAAGG